MKFTFRSLFVLVMLSVACSDDDDGAEGLPLVGTTWTEVSFEAKDCEDERKERTINCSGEDCEVFVFNEDGTITYSEASSETDYTYSVNGNQLILTIKTEFSTITSAATYEIISDQLLITIEDEDVGCTEVYTYQGS